MKGLTKKQMEAVQDILAKKGTNVEFVNFIDETLRLSVTRGNQTQTVDVDSFGHFEETVIRVAM